MVTRQLKRAMRRLDDLLVIRISDSANVEELQDKTIECSQRFVDLPGADALGRLGATPLLEPERVEGRYTRGEQFRATYFRIPGTQTQVLQVLGSATKANVGEADNAFVELLADVMDETYFSSVWVGDFGRLLRSLDYLSPTWRALKHRCAQLRHGGGVIAMSSPSAEFQFIFEAMSASNECRQVVRRTVQGKMRKYLDGRYPLGARSLPSGYFRTEEKRVALVDPAPRELVSTIVQVLGDPTLTHDERVRRVAAVGGPQNPMANRSFAATNGSDLIGRWFDQLDVWRTGTFTVDYELPALLEEVDLPVEIIDSAKGRIWRLTYQLPLPTGGWASQDAFDAAFAARDRRREHATSQGGVAAGRVRKPLCGLPGWFHDGYQYQLFSGNQNRYELRRRPEGQATVRRTIGGRPRQVARGWGVHKEGERVARLSAQELHRSVAEGLVDAATHGMTLRSATDALVAADDDVLEDLRCQLRQVEQRVANARRNANDAQTDSQRQMFLDDVNQAAAEQERLEADILRLARTNAGGSIPVDADAVAAALAAVADEQNHVPAEVADALREVLDGFTLLPHRDGTAIWHAGLKVPLAGGTLKLGPASGAVILGHSRQVAAARTASLRDRGEEAARYVIGQGLPPDEAAEKLRVRTHRRVSQAVRDYLKQRGMSTEAASVLVAYTPPSARQVVWERLHERPFPNDGNRHFAAHVAAVYLNQPIGSGTQWKTRRTLMNRTIRQLQEQGGWLPPSDINQFAQSVGISRITLDYWIKGRTQPGRHTPPILTDEQGGVGLVACPHPDCNGWATYACLLPEVPTVVICPDCRRMPEDRYSDIIFPAEYLHLPEAA